MNDFARIPGLADEWSEAMSLWFDQVVEAESKTLAKKGSKSKVQYFNPLKVSPPGPALDQSISWNAFPKELLRQFGRERALIEADTLWPLQRYRGGVAPAAMSRTFYRPHNEYCEWHVTRHPETGKIRKLTFSSEPPEYYSAMFGDGVSGYSFNGDRRVVLDLYHEFVSPKVRLKDLIAGETLIDSGGNVYVSKGQYNPWNKWNTTYGIMHLAAPPNSLLAEIQLGGDATILRQDAKGRLLVEPGPLICCAGYGGPDRNSDPTIGSTVNALARLGAMITLADPVGLYMDHIDLAGWSAPDGAGVGDCVKIARGRPGMIERLEVEVPAERGFTISEIEIGGVPIRYGGQVAECITVKLTGQAVLSKMKPVPVSCDGACCIDPAQAVDLGRSVRTGQPAPVGTVIAFVGEGEAELPAAPSHSRTSPPVEEIPERHPIRSRA
jgi:hypothetical protein